MIYIRWINVPQEKTKITCFSNIHCKRYKEYIIENIAFSFTQILLFNRKLQVIFRKFFLFTFKNNIIDVTHKRTFIKISKNLANYKSENNVIELLKLLLNYQNNYWTQSNYVKKSSEMTTKIVTF